MSGFFNGVNNQSVSQASDGFKEFKIGDNYARISKVEEKLSESGNPMLEITFADEDGATIRYYIVDGEWKLSRLKQLYQAFGIPFGETNIQRWIGKWGIVVCKTGEPYNGKVYNKVHYVRPDTDNHAPKTTQQSAQPNPAYAESGIRPFKDDNFDEIPF